MLNLETLVGLAAACGTTFSYLPQVRKCWKTRSTGDLSLKMILALCTGVTLWIVYGVMRSDLVVIIANAATITFLSFLLYFKIAEMRRGGGASADDASPSGAPHPPTAPAGAS